MNYDYSPKISAQKAGVVAASGAVGVIIEIVVDKFFPSMFPGGLITTAVSSIWAGFQNWRKNK